MRDDNNPATDEGRKKFHYLQSSSWFKWICVLEVEKECDKDANEIIGRRIQFSEIILISISEMIESMVANKDTKKKAEEEKNKENEKGSVPLQDMEGAWIGYI